MEHACEDMARALMQKHVASERPSDCIDRLPTDEATCRPLADAFDKIGIKAFNANDYETAKAAFLHLFLLRLSLVRNNPGSRADIRDFASAQDLLGRAAFEAGNYETAAEMFRESCHYREQLHREDEADVHAAYLYGVGLWHLSWVAAIEKNAEEELSLVQQAHDQLAPLNASFPNNTFIAPEFNDVMKRLNKIVGRPKGAR